MSLWNPFSFTPTGEPVPQTAPPALRVIGGQATAQQLSMAQGAFYQFCSRARLSVVPNPTEMGRLPDGSRYEIIVVGNVQMMLLWPVGGDIDIDSESGIYVEVLPPGAPQESRYLLRPKGGYANPGRPWRVTNIPFSGAPYHHTPNDPPGVIAPLYGQALHSTWHSQGGQRKNYLVKAASGWGVGRNGKLVAFPDAIGGSRSSIVREITVGETKRFGAMQISTAEVSFLVYAAEPFVLAGDIADPPGVPVLSSSTVRTVSETSLLSEQIVDVSVHPSGNRMLMLVVVGRNNGQRHPVYPDPGVDEWGRHLHKGAVSRDAEIVGFVSRNYTLSVTLGMRSIADPDELYQVEGYLRNGTSWALTSTEQTKTPGSCNPPSYRVSHDGLGPPDFAEALVIEDRQLLPFPSDVSTSGGSGVGAWSRRVVTNGGQATFKAKTDATYDEFVTLKRFGHNGGVATVRSWGVDAYRYGKQVQASMDAMIYQVVTSDEGDTSVTQYSDANYSATFNESRTTEQGVLLGERRFILQKSYASIAGGGSRVLHSDEFGVSGILHPETASGTMDVAVEYEGRDLLAYDPFLRLVCYTELEFRYSAALAATYSRGEPVFDGSLGLLPGEVVTGGSDCFLPDLAPIAATFVLECGGTVLRIPLPAAVPTEDEPDLLYLDKFVKVPSLRYLFRLPPPRPDSASNPAYTSFMQEIVARGGAGLDLDIETGRPGIRIIERDSLVFGAFLNVARGVVSIEYAADPRTGGAVLLADFKGRRPNLAYAIDKSGVRLLEEVLPDVDVEDITSIGSA